MAGYFFHETPYEASLGPLVRFVSDLDEDDYMYQCMDVGIDTNILSPHKYD